MADDEHPPIAHPRPLGIVELPCVEIVGGPASTFRSFPPPVAPPLHGPIVSGGDAGDTMSESRVCVRARPAYFLRRFIGQSSRRLHQKGGGSSSTLVGGDSAK